MYKLKANKLKINRNNSQYKSKDFKIIYQYIEPKTEEERQDQQRRIDEAYHMVFDEIDRQQKEKRIFKKINNK